MDTQQDKIHTCKTVYQWAKTYIKETRLAIDIGCRQGWFAMQMEPDFNHIHCFDFRNKKEEFKKNIKDINKFTYHTVAIGDKDGSVLTTNNRVGRIKDNGNIVIQSKRLDSFNFENVGFIKLDVEGYELKCLLGAEQTIKKFNPVIIVEQNRGNMDAVNFLKVLGYECLGADSIKNHDFLCVKR